MSNLRVLQQLSKAVGNRSRAWLCVLAAVWLAAVVGGLGMLWKYDNTPGEAARAPERWPKAATLSPAADRPTLIMVAHPHCTCTRASLGELAETIARAPRPPKTYVLFVTPKSFPEGWENTDLWRSAAAIPGVTVVRDADGAQAQRFGAATSGQTLLFDERGLLLFSGGITGARAHAGDNAGRQSLVALLNRKPSDRRGTSVFGCPLFDRAS